ncbi:hypothetical protein ACLOJK_038789 [Asimina triloba]
MRFLPRRRRTARERRGGPGDGRRTTARDWIWRLEETHATGSRAGAGPEQGAGRDQGRSKAGAGSNDANERGWPTHDDTRLDLAARRDARGREQGRSREQRCQRTATGSRGEQPSRGLRACGERVWGRTSGRLPAMAAMLR